MKRLITTAVAATLLILGCSGETPRNYDEFDISTLQRLMERGDLTARGLVEYYLNKIDATDRNGPSLNAIIELNPDALDIADALEEIQRVTRNAIDAALSEQELDALIAPSNGPAWMTDHVNGDVAFGIGSSTFAAVSGYASITVPAGFVSGLPIGMSFIGTAFSEKTLLEIAYAFEQAGMVRRPPPLE